MTEPDSLLQLGDFFHVNVRYFVGKSEKVSEFPKKARNQLFPVFFLAIFETETHQLMYLSYFITISY